MEELIVRMKALLRKTQTLFVQEQDTGIVTIGSKYSFNYQAAQLKAGDKTIALTAREAELLKLLLLNKNQVMSRQSILLHIWGNDDFFTGRSLDVFITKLRKYLQQDPSVRIMNIRGVGYKLIV